MHCCPEGSWPQLAVDYVPKGQKINIEGVETYHIGQGKRVLMIFEDIFGTESGWHRVVADIFASNGYNVFLPELLRPYYDGPMEMPKIFDCVTGQDYEKMAINFQKVLGHIKSSVGVQKMPCIGFCWGAWYSFKISTKFDCFSAIVGAHPSLHAEGLFKGTAIAMAEKVKCPAYFLPAQNDADDVKQKGQVVELLTKRFGSELTGTVLFPDMVHGWITRGDLQDEKVSRDFHKALNLIQEYLAKLK